jgi:PAS domain S-box-containing protein
MDPEQKIKQLERQLAEIKIENNALRSKAAHLKSRQELFEILGDHMPAIAAYLDAGTLTYRYLNRAAAEAFARPYEEIIGTHLREQIGPDNYQFAKPFIEQALKGMPVSYENTFELPTGTSWVRVTYTPDMDQEGRVRGIMVQAFDITELRVAQQALQKSESLHRSLFESSPTPIALQDFSACKKRLDQLAGQGVGNLQAFLESHPDEVTHLASQVKFVYANQATTEIYKTPLPGDKFNKIKHLLVKNDQQHFIEQLVTFSQGGRVYKG